VRTLNIRAWSSGSIMASVVARTDLQKRNAYVWYGVRADRPGSPARRRKFTRQAGARFSEPRSVRAQKLAIGDAIADVKDAEKALKRHGAFKQLFCNGWDHTSATPTTPTQVQDHQTLMGLFATLAGRLTQLQTLQGGEPAKVIQQTADLLSGATASQANIQNGITAYGLQQMQHQPAVPNQVNFPTQTIVRRESDDAVSAPPSPSETASSASSVAAGVPRGPG